MYIIDEKSENQEIKRLYKAIISAKITRREDGSDLKTIRKAFNLAVEAHSGMRRKSGEPYIYHPLTVALICAERLHMGTITIASAILHDVVEDTEYTVQDIESIFGEAIANIVSGLTKIKGVLHGSPNKLSSEQAENFMRLFKSIAGGDTRIVMIKIIDRLHNMQTLDSMPRHKQLKIASETKFVFAPLANALGFHSIKTELEDLVLKYIDPEIYKRIEKKRAKSIEKNQEELQLFMDGLKANLDTIGIDYILQHRVKSINSIWEKMQKQGVHFNQVYDLFAVRVIISPETGKDEEECFKAFNFIDGKYYSNRDRYRNWISSPKKNGYRALHLTVKSSNTGLWIEVQIRSAQMHEIAEKGLAAHQRYKELNKDFTSPFDEMLDNARLFDRENEETGAVDYVHQFQQDVLSDTNIIVFTPKGKKIILPPDSCPIDFAYRIHTDVGDHCMAAVVNGNTVTLNTKLMQGDVIKIITSDTYVPRVEWLDWVASPLAKKYINRYLQKEKQERQEEGITKAKAVFADLDIEFSDNNIQRLCNRLGNITPLDFYYDILHDKIPESTIRDFFGKHNNDEDKPKSRWNIFSRFWNWGASSKSDDQELTNKIAKTVRNNPDLLLLDKDAEDADMEFEVAECCNPIHGDDIVGIAAPNGPIQVHRINCPQATRLMATFGNKLIKAKWNTGGKIGFLAGIHVLGQDDLGLVNRITHIVSENYGINMRTIHFTASEGHAEGTITLYIHDSESLNKLIRNIQNVEGLERVERIDNIQQYS